MKLITVLQILTLLMSCTACNEAGNFLKGNIVVTTKESRPSISSVKIQNDQFIITGKNLESITLAKIEGSTNHQFTIESKTADKLILNAKSVLDLLVGGAFNLIVSNAHAAATFPLSFELQNGQVTASKLHHMNASTGDVLQFNGTNWAPASFSNSQVYVGTYDAATDTPDIVATGGTSGTYYIVTVAGTQDLGSGATNFDVGDWIIFNGATWSKVSVGTNTVSNFNGRTGAVVPLSGDYSWSMLTKAAGKLTGSKIQEIADVDVAGIQDGDILIWSSANSKWESGAVPTQIIGAGSVTNTQIANGAIDSTKIVDGSIVNADISATAAIDQSKINGLTTALSSKEPSITAGAVGQYWSGNKTWQNFEAGVLATDLAGYSATVGAVNAADSILSAIGKLSGNIGAASLAQGNYVLKAGDTMGGPLAMGSNKITGLATPTVGTDAANKDYVDTQVNGSSYWIKSGTDIYYSAGKVGFGLSTLAADMHVQVEDRLTDTSGRSLNIDLRQHSTVNGNYSLIGAALKSQTTLAAGVVNAGTLTGSWSVAFRNNLVGTLDNGTLAGIRGNYIQYGHYDSEATSVPLTTDVFGLHLSPYYKKGTITNLYDIYVHPGSPGGTVTNYYGLHLSGPIKKHYLEGNLGLNVLSPSEKLDVSGNIALDGKVRFKSNTANFVELRAPAGLAGTIAFNLPGTSGTSGQALVTDGAGNLSWTTVASGTPADGSIGYAKLNLADGDIPLAKLAGASDATKYLKGDKSWGTFITDVLASTFATVIPSNTAIANGDSLQTVVNKTQGQINNLATNSLNKTGTDSVTGTLTINPATGALKIPATPSGVDLTDAANVQYVQNYVDTFGKWLKSGSNIYFSTGNVGIGSSSTTGPAGIEAQLKILRPLNKWGLMIEGDGTNQSDILLNTPNNSANNRVGQIVNAADKFIFRALNDDMTQKTQLMTMLLSSGYVGIGTATPLRPFHVTQSAAAGGNVAPMMIQRVNTSGTPAGNELTVIQFQMPNSAGTGVVGADIGATLTDVTPGSEKGAIIFRTSANGGSTIPEKMRIDSSGNVGINVASPTFKLDVGGSARIQGQLNFQTPIAGWNEFVNRETSAAGFRFYTGANGTNGDTVIDTNGYLGLGTNAPKGSIHVKGAAAGLFLEEVSGGVDNEAYIVHYNNVLEIQNRTSAGVLSVIPFRYDMRAPSDSIFVNSSGNMGLGTSSPTGKLDVNGTVRFGGGKGSLSYFNTSPYDQAEFSAVGPTTNLSLVTNSVSRLNITPTSGFVGIHTVTPAYTLDVNGDLRITGIPYRNGGDIGWTVPSDKRLKDVTGKFEAGAEEISKIETIKFRYKKGNKKDISSKEEYTGVIAQEVQKQIPEAVKKDKDGFLSLNTTPIFWAMVNSIKELFTQSQKHEREIASLKEENRLLKESLCEMNPKAKVCKIP